MKLRKTMLVTMRTNNQRNQYKRFSAYVLSISGGPKSKLPRETLKVENQ